MRVLIRIAVVLCAVLLAWAGHGARADQWWIDDALVSPLISPISSPLPAPSPPANACAIPGAIVEGC